MSYKVITSLTAMLMGASMLITTPAIATDHAVPKEPFTNCYQGISGLYGAPSLNLEVVFHPDGSLHGKVTGESVISFPSLIHPIYSALKGNYFSPVIHGGPYRTHLYAKGYPLLLEEVGDDGDSDIPPNLKLHMELDPTLESGTASYKYRKSWIGSWSNPIVVPVAKISCEAKVETQAKAQLDADANVPHSDVTWLVTTGTNQLKVGDKAWFLSTFTDDPFNQWNLKDNNSGLELVGTVTLDNHGLAEPVLMRYIHIWQFEAKEAGNGTITFQNNYIDYTVTVSVE